MQKFVIFALILPLFAKTYKNYPLPFPYTEKCIVGLENQYPPQNQPAIPWYVVDLDEAPIDRWTKIATLYAPKIQAVLNTLKNFSYQFFHGKLFKWIDDTLKNWDQIFPQPYQDELKGIAIASGIPLGEIVFANLFYDLKNFCTSIVAENEKGEIFHVRNMDFGEFFGWNISTHEWIMTEA